MPPALPQLDGQGNFATSAAKTYQPRFCSSIAALVLDSVHQQQHDVLRHAYFMREVVSKFKLVLPEYESAQPEEVPDFVPRGILESDIPLDARPLLDWISSEQVHGPDDHGPLPDSSS